MKTDSFIHRDFLLQTDAGQKYYHGIASQLPIIDFHNHLDITRLSEKSLFKNISELWIDIDPYKHRAMRMNGIPENEITGSMDPKRKFENWAKTVVKTLGNPLFHWSCIELKEVFGVDEVLTERNYLEIWNHCNHQISSKDFHIGNELKKLRVEKLGTSDDLLDSTEFHGVYSDWGLSVTPTLRGDSVLNFETMESEWLEKLSVLSGFHLDSFDDYKKAIVSQLERFSRQGCQMADHSLDSGFIFNLGGNPDQLFQQFMREGKLGREEASLLKCHLLQFLGEEYAKRGWAMQLHMGAQRETSTRLKNIIGEAGGYATIGQSFDVTQLIRFLDSLEQKSKLPNIILFNLNPADNSMFAALTGSFVEEGVSGKIQFGPAWWYNDHLEGIQNQLKALANHGLMFHFIGMTTDSRSYLSLYRHDYFRRILCDMAGDWVERGLIPDDDDLIGELIKAVCYENAKKWI